jgi:hypothetical protein
MVGLGHLILPNPEAKDLMHAVLVRVVLGCVMHVATDLDAVTGLNIAIPPYCVTTEG